MRSTSRRWWSASTFPEAPTLWFEDAVALARRAVPTETQVMVKREDEQAFAELNAANPIFVEDAARLFAERLLADPRPERRIEEEHADVVVVGRRPHPPGRVDAEAVFNGIAWDKAAKKLYVAGKWWGRLYEIKVLR